MTYLRTEMQYISCSLTCKLNRKDASGKWAFSKEPVSFFVIVLWLNMFSKKTESLLIIQKLCLSYIESKLAQFHRLCHMLKSYNYFHVVFMNKCVKVVHFRLMLLMKIRTRMTYFINDALIEQNLIFTTVRPDGINRSVYALFLSRKNVSKVGLLFSKKNNIMGYWVSERGKKPYVIHAAKSFLQNHCRSPLIQNASFIITFLQCGTG